MWRSSFASYKMLFVYWSNDTTRYLMEQKTLKILDLLNERRLLLSEMYNGEILDRDLVVFQIAIDSKPAIFLEASRKNFLFKSETASKLVVAEQRLGGGLIAPRKGNNGNLTP